MDSHIRFLERKIYNLGKHDHPLSRPTQFEYYSAIQLSRLYKKSYYVWKDLTPIQKEKAEFPINDKGIDLAEETFSSVAQVKYYGEKQSIGYGKLATFCGMPVLTGKNLILNLLRTSHSCLSSDIQGMIKGGRMNDIPLCNRLFLETCERIQMEGVIQPDDEKKEEFVLKPPQQGAKKTLIQSDSEQRNAIIHLPTGLGKTITFLDYERMYTGCTLILVPTLVLLQQWFEEACKMGFPEETIYRIGSEDHNDFTKAHLSYRLILCVFNSCPLVLPYFTSFRKIAVDEAHRIFASVIYQEEDDYIEDEEEDEDNYEDEEDEEDETLEQSITSDDRTSYLSQLHTSIKHSNKCVLLSATIEPISDWLYYGYSVREAITAGYITDYQLVFPIFNDDPTDRNVAEYLIRKGETHCIIYTSSIEKCEAFTGLLNQLLPNSAASLHSGVSKQKRGAILSQFERGDIRFIVNVRVLAEGFNSTICSSIMFLHMSSNDIFIIQCIGRALRLHPDKTVATIYLPFHTENQEHHIATFLQHLCKTDSIFEKVCSSKTVGTYVSLEKVKSFTKDEDDNMDEEDSDSIAIEHRYDLVFDSMGNHKGMDVWERRREEWVKWYERTKRLPSHHSEDIEERRAGAWQSLQRYFYKNKTDRISEDRIQILNQTEGWKWEKDDTWSIQLEHWKKQYEKLGKTPSQESKDPEEKKAGQWQSDQRKNYKKGQMPQDRIQMLNETDGWKWEDDSWLTQFQNWKIQYQTLGRNPLEDSKNSEEKKAGQWQSHQRHDYKKGKMPQDRIQMLNETDGWKWEEEDLWTIKLEKWIEQYSILGGMLSTVSQNPEEKESAVWQSIQRQCFRKGKMPEDRVKILENTKGWIWKDDRWQISYEHWKKQYIRLGKKPSSTSKDSEEKQAGSWQQNQRCDYRKGKISQDRITILEATKGWKWEEEVTWPIQLENWKRLYKRLGKSLSDKSKDPEVKRLGQWQSDQRQNYKKGKMPQDHIQMLNETDGWKWEEEDTWPIQLEHWKKQYEIKGRTPSGESKDPEEKKAGQWQQNQRRNYKKGKMSQEYVRILNKTSGWKWEEEDTWPIQLEHWKKEYEIKGRTPSSTSKDPEEKKAGKWQSKERQKYRKGKMSEEYIKILNETDGWKWEEEDTWPIQLEHWKGQYHILGKIPSPRSENLEEKKAGQWQSQQRQNYKKGKMPQDRILMLNETDGWKWPAK
jgi:superfamily II DNA or RNA helicase